MSYYNNFDNTYDKQASIGSLLKKKLRKVQDSLPETEDLGRGLGRAGAGLAKGDARVAQNYNKGVEANRFQRFYKKVKAQPGVKPVTNEEDRLKGLVEHFKTK